VHFGAVEDVIANAMGSFAWCMENAIRERELGYTAIARSDQPEQIVGLVVGVEEGG
jgi:hypothetical protein